MARARPILWYTVPEALLPAREVLRFGKVSRHLNERQPTVAWTLAGREYSTRPRKLCRPCVPTASRSPLPVKCLVAGSAHGTTCSGSHRCGGNGCQISDHAHQSCNTHRKCHQISYRRPYDDFAAAEVVQTRSTPSDQVGIRRRFQSLLEISVAYFGTIRLAHGRCFCCSTSRQTNEIC